MLSYVNHVSGFDEEDDDMYTVDGNTGAQIVKQLSKGDKIRVGINGRVQSHDLRIRNKKSPRDKRSVTS